MKNTKIAIKIPHIQFIAAGGIQWGDIQGHVYNQQDMVDFINNAISSNVADSLIVIKNALEDIELDISTLQANENGIQADVSSIKNDITTINAAIDSINTEISNIQSDISMVEGKVSTIEGLVDLINTSIDNINIELTTVNNSITNIENRVVSVEGDITSIQGDITTINADISDIQDDITTINSTVYNIQTDLNTVINNLESFKLTVNEWAKNKKVTRISVDCNTLINNGIYYVQYDSLNLPFLTAPCVILVVANGSYVYHLAYRQDTIAVRYSANSGGSWSQWYIQAHQQWVNGQLNTKVDKANGMGLSSNDFTTVLLQKLNAIEDQAQKNVQSNWVQADTTADDYIKNKPYLGDNIVYNVVQDTLWDTNITLVSQRINPNDGTTNISTCALTMASATRAGVMSKESYQQITKNTADIAALKGSNFITDDRIQLVSSLPSTPLSNVLYLIPE